jgi:thiol-disulfide isomerase/thioredoxin
MSNISDFTQQNTMTRIFIAAIVAVFMGVKCHSQTLIGTLKNYEKWSNVVYLMKINNINDLFSGSDKFIVDSSLLTNDGSYSFQHIEYNTLYRINIVPKGKNISRGVIINNGINDNYAFFLRDSQTNHLVINADADSLFRTYQLTPNSGSIKALLKLRKIKQPVYDALAKVASNLQLTDSLDSTANVKNKMLALNNLQKVLESTNRELKDFLHTVENPIVLVLGFSFYNYDVNVNNHPELYEICMPVLTKNSDLPIISSLLKELKSKNEFFSLGFLKPSYKSLDTQRIKLDSGSHNLILLDFWASWCAPCRKEIRTTLKFLKEQYQQELKIVGINLDENKSIAKQAIKEDDNQFVQIWDKDSQPVHLSGLFNATYLPHYVIIDKKKMKVYDNVNTFSLEKTILELLNASK